ncbi:MAG TPA: metallophosphoesterase family protein [Kofleriaceae bacterium]|nr:metallophosphoesterase family protein [Kofleriaceae bacterium]
MFARTAEIVELLLTVGYVDGLFHHKEHAYIRRYMESVRGLVGPTNGTDLESTFNKLAREVAVLGEEVRASGSDTFVPTRLKTRAVTLFRNFPPTEQTSVLELVRGLMHADGLITQPEKQLYEELIGHFTGPPTPKAAAATATDMVAPASTTGKPLVLQPAAWLDLQALGHPVLDPLEQTYSPHPIERKSQIDLDYQLVHQAMDVWERQRAQGNGRLNGITDISRFAAGTRFLDQHIYVQRPAGGTEYIVLGDLHGCYGCLKAALLQTDFINRAWAHQWDPARYPDVKLILLGDYIDRGRFSFDGVLRAVLRLLVSLPDQVIVLRGNHEHFRFHEGSMYSVVYPAEALASISAHVPFEMLDAYRVLFEKMPTACLVDRTMFVHGGVPRDDTFAERYRDLSSLNDPDLRFQMMWSDPEQTDHVPVELQRQNPRFMFGRKQFRAFMEKVGMHTMIRGHEKIDRGFDVVYNLGDRLLLNLFSAGGWDNNDLPPDGSYRSVTPMALTIYYRPEESRAVPWPIHYQPFNYDVHNGLHRAQPLLEFRYG